VGSAFTVAAAKAAKSALSAVRASARETVPDQDEQLQVRALRGDGDVPENGHQARRRPTLPAAPRGRTMAR
jgi:hypothetical protein